MAQVMRGTPARRNINGAVGAGATVADKNWKVGSQNIVPGAGWRDMADAEMFAVANSTELAAVRQESAGSGAGTVRHPAPFVIRGEQGLYRGRCKLLDGQRLEPHWAALTCWRSNAAAA
jgi:hypothetical protein